MDSGMSDRMRVRICIHVYLSRCNFMCVFIGVNASICLYMSLYVSICPYIARYVPCVLTL